MPADGTRWYRISDAMCEAVVNRYTVSGSPVDGKDEKSFLHWRFFVTCTLPTGNAQSAQSIKLDLIPGRNGSTDIITATELSYEISKTSVADVSENATARTTVQDLLDLLESHGRHRYIYNSDGSGCCFWCRTVLGNLEGGELVASGAVNRFDAYIAAKKPREPCAVPTADP